MKANAFLKIHGLVALMIAIASPAAAEYRAFELVIENTETGTERTVITTLDHIQYPQYHPLNKNETIRYVDSWMCWENTNQRPICKREPAAVK